MLAGCKFLAGDIERYGTGTVEMYHLMIERGLKLPLISHDEYFKLTIRRPSAGTTNDTVHDTTHDTTHDGTETYREIAELEHWLVLVIPNEMNRLLILKSAQILVGEEITKFITVEVTGEAGVHVTVHVTDHVTDHVIREVTREVPW